MYEPFPYSPAANVFDHGEPIVADLPATYVPPAYVPLRPAEHRTRTSAEEAALESLKDPALRARVLDIMERSSTLSIGEAIARATGLTGPGQYPPADQPRQNFGQPPFTVY
jgi:hypothetical protein